MTSLARFLPVARRAAHTAGRWAVEAGRWVVETGRRVARWARPRAAQARQWAVEEGAPRAARAGRWAAQETAQAGRWAADAGRRAARQAGPRAAQARQWATREAAHAGRWAARGDGPGAGGARRRLPHIPRIVVAAGAALATLVAVAAVAAAQLPETPASAGRLITAIGPAAVATSAEGLGWTARWTAGPKRFVDAGGRVWEPDAAVAAGGSVRSGVAGGRVAVPYRWTRTGTPTWTLPVPSPGTYAVVLSFAATAAKGSPDAEVTVRLADGTAPRLRLAGTTDARARHAVVLARTEGSTVAVAVEAAAGVGGVSAISAIFARTSTELLHEEFSDDFEGAAGRPDPKRWRFQTGATGWGNGELQNYTDRPDNGGRTGDGHLAIVARQDGTGYTSARMRSVFEARYGRIEAELRVPSGAGLLPAFWMLGADVDRAGWPQAGEIDIMESLGDAEPGIVHGAVHGPDGSVRGWERTWIARPSGGPAKGFHRYGLEWWPGVLQWSVDGVVQGVLRPEDLSAKERWVFEAPAFLLLNVAVGGRWPGNPPPATVFPQTMLVDAVHWWR
ncbi:glycoside hydrolase family 16 protein [Dactylosporangium sp. AC04546]|uniref:glycoside hydrolase family 16 protein n=1 Tax=Dactylosporangium sp. AC04546 TaxID=2862460 RepID=UPI001EE0FD25|nr:glycoside hydrolase family 16 protein [Dactylosporangium sp. AC04546]WVK86172.1 glycoside hydrolase family 16 protein [Dactylosporangium sp. AC04546]